MAGPNGLFIRKFIHSYTTAGNLTAKRYCNMKNLGEKFSISINDYSREEIEVCVLKAGFKFDINCPYKLTYSHIAYSETDNDFYYRSRQSGKNVTINELKDILGLSKERSKEYVLKMDVSRDYNGDPFLYSKGAKVKDLHLKIHKPIEADLYKITGSEMVVTGAYVEEKKPLLSHVINYKDTVIDRHDYKYQYLGVSREYKDIKLWDERFHEVRSFNLTCFNKEFKLV